MSNTYTEPPDVTEALHAADLRRRASSDIQGAMVYIHQRKPGRAAEWLLAASHRQLDDERSLADLIHDIVEDLT